MANIPRATFLRAVINQPFCIPAATCSSALLTITAWGQLRKKHLRKRTWGAGSRLACGALYWRHGRGQRQGPQPSPPEPSAVIRFISTWA